MGVTAATATRTEVPACHGGGDSEPLGFFLVVIASLSWDAFDLDAVLAWAYLIVFGSLIAFTAYVCLLQNAPISKVATYAHVNPVIAILLGALILSEDVTLTIRAGALIIVGSVAAIVRQESG